MVSEKTIIEKCAAKQHDMEKFLESIVNIDSKIDNPEGCAEVAHKLGEKLAKAGMEVEYIGGNGKPTHVHAVKKSDNPNAKNFLIMGHMDTVFDKGTAKERPFRIEGDKAYGPGVADMKSGLTIAVHTLETLYEEGWNEHNITVLFAGDEEPGHPETNFREYLMDTAKGMDAAFNFETGMESGDLAVARRGIIYPIYKVEGIAASSGKEPEKGASAIKELMYKILEAYDLTDNERGINFNAGLIRGGIVANGIAGHAEMEGDFRFDNADDKPYIEEKLQEIADEVRVPKTKTTLIIDEARTMLPMVKLPGAEPIFKVIQEQAKKIGREVKPVLVGSGADSCWTTHVGVPTICAMGGRGGLSHSDKEFLIIDSLTDRTQIAALTLMNL